MFKKLLILFLLFSFLSSCAALKPKKVDTRETPVNAQERARKNIEEGKGVSIGGLLGRGGAGTNYEFSTSNPLWRASLEVLDFLPLTTVDYSGGMIITDWYSENNSEESLKITVRFLNNEVRTESLKILVHRKKCQTINSCKISLLKRNNSINEELLAPILRIAATLEKQKKK